MKLWYKTKLRCDRFGFPNLVPRPGFLYFCCHHSSQQSAVDVELNVELLSTIQEWHAAFPSALLTRIVILSLMYCFRRFFFDADKGRSIE